MGNPIMSIDKALRLSNDKIQITEYSVTQAVHVPFVPVVTMTRDSVEIGCTFVERSVVELLYRQFQDKFPAGSGRVTIQ
mgnify:CR=1 FL=1